MPTLRLDYLGDYGNLLPDSLDPAQVETHAEESVSQLVYANLVKILPSGAVAPDLATWTISDDHLIYTFAIRPTARFSNGDFVTARDVHFSLERSLLASAQFVTAAPDYLSLIKGASDVLNGGATRLTGVRVLDARRLTITVTKPVTYFLRLLAYPTGDVVDARILASKTTSVRGNSLDAHCPSQTGAGPFMFVCSGNGYSFEPRSIKVPHRLVLEPNPYYYGRRPRIRLVLPTSATVPDSYTNDVAGSLDTTPAPAKALHEWRHSRQYHVFPNADMEDLILNVHSPPFDNIHCRRAVAYAIDRERIAHSVRREPGTPAYSLLPKGYASWSSRGKIEPHYDPAAARKESTACGTCLPIYITYMRCGAEVTPEYAVVQANLQAAGLSGTLSPVDCGDFMYSFPMSHNGTMMQQCFPCGPWLPYDQEYLYLYRMLDSASRSNLGQWKSKRFDSLPNTAATTWNKSARVRLYREAERIALRQAPTIPLVEGQTRTLIKPYVHGLVGTVFFDYLVPARGDWSNVTVGPH
ncbi:MAG: hypothetical protein DLM70_00165 [Chloroflexi bacterium]|nr:MAG: hypothetical protein DLM70_00165 [Chloroflexota bacterium]